MQGLLNKSLININRGDCIIGDEILSFCDISKWQKDRWEVWAAEYQYNLIWSLSEQACKSVDNEGGFPLVIKIVSWGWVLCPCF